MKRNIERKIIRKEKRAPRNERRWMRAKEVEGIRERKDNERV